MRYDDKRMITPEQLTLAPPICRLAGDVLSIGRRVMQKGIFVLKGSQMVTIRITSVHCLNVIEQIPQAPCSTIYGLSTLVIFSVHICACVEGLIIENAAFYDKFVHY